MILISLITGTIITLTIHQYMKSEENKLRGLSIWKYLSIISAMASTAALIVLCIDLPNLIGGTLNVIVAYVIVLIHCYIAIAVDGNFKYLEREIDTLKKQNRDTATKAPSTYKRTQQN